MAAHSFIHPWEAHNIFSFDLVDKIPIFFRNMLFIENYKYCLINFTLLVTPLSSSLSPSYSILIHSVKF